MQIAFTIETNDSTSAKISQEKNAEISSRVIAKLKEAGLTDQDIKTTSFSVQLIYADKYTCPDALDDCDYYDRIYASELVGYKTTHEYLIKYGETPKAGDLVDRLSIGGNELTVDSIQFALKPETRDEIERQLLADAGKDARNKAERIASGLGASLGRLTSASENIDTSYGSSRLALSFMAEDVGAESYSTEVFASDIEVVATISATFEIQ